jgi:CheY-like chemotaxis protein
METPVLILVAEDDPNDVMLLRRAFYKAGVEVPIRFVRDGQEVIDYLEARPPFEDPVQNPVPTLLLLDLKMPRLNGFEVLEWLRRQAFLHRLPVVIFSASSEPEDRRRAYSLGAGAYVVKPQDPDQFMQVVQLLKRYWVDINFPPPDLATEREQAEKAG